MDSQLAELNVITLNCWGLLHLSAHRAARLAAIGRQLAAKQPVPHIVALQECWTQEDYRTIRRETQYILPYGKFYHSGVIGGGLAILSKWPIEESSMFKYPLNGLPTAFFRGDWFAGKGVACARIRYGIGEKDVVEVFNTHTHAIYHRPPETEPYTVHRLSQSWEIAKLARGAAERGHLVLALGDFNDTPLSLAHRIITAHAPVRDVWRVLHPDSSLGETTREVERTRRRPIPTAIFNLLENGATSGSEFNTWRWEKSQQTLLGPGKDPLLVPDDRPCARGKRLDYIFASAGATPLAKARWVVSSARVGMTERHPELQCSLSDHFSVEATLVLHTPHSSTSGTSRLSTDSATAISHDEAAVSNGTYLQSPTSSEFRGRGPAKAAPTYDEQLRDAAQPPDALPASTYDEMLNLIGRYRAREQTQRTWRGRHFLAWVVVTLGCWIGVWFVPHNYVAFILMVLCTLGLAAGTVDGLIALLFYRTELQALREFEWEVRNARALAAGELALQQEKEVKNW